MTPNLISLIDVSHEAFKRGRTNDQERSALLALRNRSIRGDGYVLIRKTRGMGTLDTFLLYDAVHEIEGMEDFYLGRISTFSIGYKISISRYNSDNRGNTLYKCLSGKEELVNMVHMLQQDGESVFMSYFDAPKWDIGESTFFRTIGEKR